MTETPDALDRATIAEAFNPAAREVLADLLRDFPEESQDVREGRGAAIHTDWALAAMEAFASRSVEDARREGWQPIETAPKDGSTIDVWRDGSRETVYWGLPPHCCGEMGQYCDSDWHSITKPGWICSTFGEFVGGKHDPFTHWRPLPDAPERDGE